MAEHELLHPIANPYDRFEHYQLQTGPTHEFAALPEIPVTIRNIGWTLVMIVPTAVPIATA